MDVQEQTDTYIKGSIDVTKAGRLVLPIANEEGWSLYVDGKKTEAKYYADTFISVSLDEGQHKIELRYETPCLVMGAIISGICVVIFVILCMTRYFIGKHPLCSHDVEVEEKEVLEV